MAEDTLHIRRAKGGRGGTHTMDRVELRDFCKLRKEAGNSLLVFETERGGPMSVDSLQRIVKEAGQAAGLDVEAHPHMLRHAADYFLINAGHDVRTAQDYLGHKNIASTAICSALSPKRLAAGDCRFGGYHETSHSVFLNYLCSNCQEEEKIFALFLEPDTSNADSATLSGECYKLGEYPAFVPHVPSRLRACLGMRVEQRRVSIQSGLLRIALIQINADTEATVSKRRIYFPREH